MGRTVFALVVASFGCSRTEPVVFPPTTIELDAGTDAPPPCEPVSACETDEQCASEMSCNSEWCTSDKGDPTHWCICDEPNPGIGKCTSKADCRPDNVCWRWECVDSFCKPIMNDGGTP